MQCGLRAIGGVVGRAIGRVVGRVGGRVVGRSIGRAIGRSIGRALGPTKLSSIAIAPLLSSLQAISFSKLNVTVQKTLSQDLWKKLVRFRDCPSSWGRNVTVDLRIPPMCSEWVELVHTYSNLGVDWVDCSMPTLNVKVDTFIQAIGPKARD